MASEPVAHMQSLIDQASNGIDGRPLIFWHEPEGADWFVTADAGKWWWRLDRGDDALLLRIAEIMQIFGDEMPDPFWVGQHKIRDYPYKQLLHAADNHKLIKRIIGNQVSPTYDASSDELPFEPQRVAITRGPLDYDVTEYAAIVASSTAVALRTDDLIGFKCDAGVSLRATHDEALLLVRNLVGPAERPSDPDLRDYMEALAALVHRPGTQPVEWSARNWNEAREMLRSVIAGEDPAAPRSAQRMLDLLNQGRPIKKKRFVRIPSRKRLQVTTKRMLDELPGGTEPIQDPHIRGLHPYMFSFADKIFHDDGRFELVDEGTWTTETGWHKPDLTFWPAGDSISGAQLRFSELNHDGFPYSEQRHKEWAEAASEHTDRIQFDFDGPISTVDASFPYNALAAQAAISLMPLYDKLCSTYVAREDWA